MESVKDSGSVLANKFLDDITAGVVWYERCYIVPVSVDTDKLLISF